MSVHLLRKGAAFLLGNYIVMESNRYGLLKDYHRLRRFSSLRKAKAFAKQESLRLKSRVVVVAADTLAKMYVYQPKANQDLQLVPLRA